MGGRHRLHGRLVHAQAPGPELVDVLLDHAFGLGVYDRAHVGGQYRGVAHMEFLHGAAQHGQQLLGTVFLHAKQAQGRAALACAVKSRGQDIRHRLLDQGG